MFPDIAKWFLQGKITQAENHATKYLTVIGPIIQMREMRYSYNPI